MTRYCGRDFSFEELEKIRTLIADNPGFTRAKLSREVCHMFQWLKPDGKLNDQRGISPFPHLPLYEISIPCLH
jgi:hypothetical protein